MSASAGDFVTPGTRVLADQNTSLGDGIIDTESGPLALLTGKLILEDGVMSIQIPGSTANLPKIGDVVIGQVNRLNAKSRITKIPFLL